MKPVSCLQTIRNYVIIVPMLLGWHCTRHALSKEIKPTCDFKDGDVQFFDVRIDATQVPANPTTYVCQKKVIPISFQENFHAIGFLPLINNTEVVHHMILFGCTDRSNGEKIHRCGNGDNECRQFMVQWSRGLEGPICNHPNAGNLFGFGSIKSMSLQIHWNNQLKAEGMQDRSGFRVFYTSNLRRYNIGNVQIGQNELEIPPGQSRVQQNGGCSSECTKNWLPQPIYLTRAHIHMHYTGDGGLIEIVRNGSVISTVVEDKSYDYAQPPAHSFANPVKVLPGDEVRVTCIFNTKDGSKRRNTTLYWGEGSDGEMCYAFVTYYPMVKNFDQCIQFDKFDICTRNGFSALGECIFPGFLRVFVGMGDEIIHKCSTATSTQSHDDALCNNTCRAAIKEVKNHPCMQGRLQKEAERKHLPQVPSWPAVKTIMDNAEKIC